MFKSLRLFSKPENMLVFTAFITSLVWAMLVPVWHFPDEQAHFAQVQNTSELGRDPQGSLDLSQEIAESERVLETLRDARGNNSFTGNPGFNLSYPAGFEGARERQLKSLPPEARKVFVARESPRYPPLFYWYSAAWYQMGYGSDLFTRVLLVRLGSSFLFAGIVFISYKLGQELFPKEKAHALSVATLVAFHPMLLFVSSGINNDTLVTLIASAITVLGMQLIRLGYSFKRVATLALLFALGMLTKQTIFLLTPFLLIVLVATFLKHRGSIKKVLLFMFVALLSLLAVYLLMKLLNQGFWLPYWPLSVNEMIANPNFLPSLQSLLARVYRETLPWYWGVFKWLGVVFPLPLIRVFKLLMIASFVGWIVFLIEVVRKKTRIEHGWQWLALVLGNVGYVAGLIAWELSAILRLGFGHGIQGRYFFPLIVSQMALLYVGWLQLVPKSLRARYTKMLTITLVGLGIYSLWYVLSQYYSLESAHLFFQQASHYKSSFAKWPFLAFWILAWMGMLTSFIIKTVTRKH
jgi:4-amino-4-deoxy-L-arabinose transferase-like glycosyltransferase